MYKEELVAPIGLFDSGIGGTTIWKAVNELLPLENTIFLADSKNAPYGKKNREEVIELCEKNTEYLLNKKCKIIVVACNTATVSAVAHLRAKYDVPFVGVEPAIKPAALHSLTKKIGVLATKSTLESPMYSLHRKYYTENNGIIFIERVGEGLVEIVETNRIKSFLTKELLEQHLAPMVENNIDYLVLGCTHYPYFKEQMQKILPTNVKIIDSSCAIARQTKVILEKNNILNKINNSVSHLWITNKNADILSSFLPPKTTVTVLTENF